jgi:hypothetical protein
VSEDQQSLHSDPLLPFCEGVVSRHANNWPPSEETLAREFLSQFPISPVPKPENLKEFGTRLGIEVSFRALPQELPGYNCSYDERKEIVIREKEGFPGVITHSFFHEVREIIEGIFVDLGHPTESGKQLEKRAEDFAREVRWNSGLNTLGPVIEEIRTIPSKWRRWGSFVLVLIFALSYGAGCALLPYFEDRIPPDN